MSGQEDLTTQYQKLVEDEWVNEQATQSWARWHEKLTIQGAAMTERLASHARIREGMTILDLSCGTGDPAITLARMVGPAGHVTAADLSPGMVETTRIRRSASARRCTRDRLGMRRTSGPGRGATAGRGASIRVAVADRPPSTPPAPGSLVVAA
jgi:SAM-dependent methyltransferase